MSSQKPKLLDQVRAVLRTKHYALALKSLRVMVCVTIPDPDVSSGTTVMKVPCPLDAWRDGPPSDQ
jgi:hypothetical protein